VSSARGPSRWFSGQGTTTRTPFRRKPTRMSRLRQSSARRPHQSCWSEADHPVRAPIRTPSPFELPQLWVFATTLAEGIPQAEHRRRLGAFNGPRSDCFRLPGLPHRWGLPGTSAPQSRPAGLRRNFQFGSGGTTHPSQKERADLRGLALGFRLVPVPLFPPRDP